MNDHFDYIDALFFACCSLAFDAPEAISEYEHEMEAMDMDGPEA